MKNNLDEIEKELKAAKPGPWKLKGDQILAEKKTGDHVWDDSMGHYPSMQLIANAPTHIGNLIEEVKELREKYKNLVVASHCAGFTDGPCLEHMEVIGAAMEEFPEEVEASREKMWGDPPTLPDMKFTKGGQ